MSWVTPRELPASAMTVWAQSRHFKLLDLHRLPRPRCPAPASSSNSRRVFSASLLHTRATADAALGKRLQDDFSSSSLRVYRNDDVIGTELGGALKNIIALAAGVVTGLGLGHNAAAALITRGSVEMTRLTVACGGHPETIAGLAGIGDLVLTCTGGLSRNRSVGIELGRGRKLADILAGLNGKVAEAGAIGKSRRFKVVIVARMYSIAVVGMRPLR